MKRRSTTPYLILIGTLLLLLSLPKHVTESLRGSVAAFFGPLWESYTQFKLFSARKFDAQISIQEELSKSLLENELLKMELSRLNDIFQSELNLQTYLKELDSPTETTVKLTQQRRKQLRELLKVEMSAIPAKVIYRTPSAWNSTFWINAGSDKGLEMNSPVVVGDAIIGVVDYLGNRQARVRLITDSALTPAVRVIRGGVQQEHFSFQVEEIEDYLLRHGELFESTEQKQLLLSVLEKLQRQLKTSKNSQLLAKGELQGSGAPLWRSSGKTLHGVGFNYDFADEDGEARDLRTGKRENDWNDTAIPLVEPHDLLVTSGMDGVFPPGLKVATVLNVSALKEGDIAYQLTARPVAKDLDDLSVVYVLRPVGYNPNH
jgi:cell shape-determining protein MreC